jgi:hypothetical protein
MTKSRLCLDVDWRPARSTTPDGFVENISGRRKVFKLSELTTEDTETQRKSQILISSVSLCPLW